MHRVWVVVLLIGCSGDAVLKQAEAEMSAEEARLRMVVEAKAQVERLQRDLVETDQKIGTAIDDVVAAQTQDDRDSAMVKLDTLRREKAQLEQTLRVARERARGTQMPRECLDNPLAKGCS